MKVEDLRLVGRESCAVCDGTGSRERTFDDPTGHGERVPCGNCDGTGKTDVEIPIEILVAHILDRVRQPLIGETVLEVVIADLKMTMTGAAARSRGLADGDQVGSWLRVCQEAAEALRSVGELRPQARDH
jgi:hypothetical protein